MAHRIATSLCWAEPFAWWAYPGPTPDPVSLYVAFLDAQGKPYVFQQLPPGGVWSGTGSAPRSPAFPLSTPQSFTSIVGVQNYLVALGTDGNLYCAVYSQSGPAPQPNDWSAFTGLMQLSSVFGPGAEGTKLISDFSVIALAPTSLVIGAAFSFAARGLAGFYSYNLNLQNSKTNVAQAVLSNPGGWAKIDVVYVQGATGASAPALGLFYDGWNPTIAFIGFSAAAPPSSPALSAYSSTDGHTWDNGQLPQDVSPLQPTSIMIAPGNPGGTLQAIMLVNSQPVLLYSVDGANWNFYGDLIPPKVVNPPTFLAAAAGNGNSGNLQLVGIGPTVYPPNLPYLIWQDTAGAWSEFPSAPAGDGYVEWTCLASDFADNSKAPTDLSIGIGFCEQGSALQVCYLGSDGHVYVSWQDTEGTWRWYAGLSGIGLP